MWQQNNTTISASTPLPTNGVIRHYFTVRFLGETEAKPLVTVFVKRKLKPNRSKIKTKQNQTIMNGLAPVWFHGFGILVSF